jgi:hypothetical protein
MHTKMRIAVALAIVALLALPGEAKTVDNAAAAAPTTHAQPQQTFGLFLDPHAEPALHIELPAGYWSF